MNGLRTSKGARRYNDRITLTLREVTRDDYGHAIVGDPVDVLDVYAEIRQMSATKTMMTFQQADVVGLDIEFRTPYGKIYNGIRWRGHEVHFAALENIDNRDRYTRISGWYQTDNPQY